MIRETVCVTNAVTTVAKLSYNAFDRRFDSNTCISRLSYHLFQTLFVAGEVAGYNNILHALVSSNRKVVT